MWIPAETFNKQTVDTTGTKSKKIPISVNGSHVLAVFHFSLGIGDKVTNLVRQVYEHCKAAYKTVILLSVLASTFSSHAFWGSLLERVEEERAITYERLRDHSRRTLSNMGDRNPFGFRFCKRNYMIYRRGERSIGLKRHGAACDVARKIVKKQPKNRFEFYTLTGTLAGRLSAKNIHLFSSALGVRKQCIGGSRERPWVLHGPGAYCGYEFYKKGWCGQLKNVTERTRPVLIGELLEGVELTTTMRRLLKKLGDMEPELKTECDFWREQDASVLFHLWCELGKLATWAFVVQKKTMERGYLPPAAVVPAENDDEDDGELEEVSEESDPGDSDEE